MLSGALLTLGVLASVASAKQCTNLTVPVTVSSRNGVFGNIATPQTALDATTFIQNLTRQGGNFSEQALTGYATVSGTYNISGTFCKPSNGSTSTVQILTHGIGFDRSYWDIPYNGYNYSYVNTAVDTFGYSTFSYDRLGIGQSSHGEPLNEIQAPLEVAALAQITMMLRNGTISQIGTPFSKVVHVGHSFGSAQTFALSAMSPTLSDAIVLTGFSANMSFINYFAAGADFQQANLNQPLRFGSLQTALGLNTFLQNYGLTDVLSPVDVTALIPLNYPNGYLANSNVNSNQYNFLYPPYFDPEIAYFGEANKQPVTVGELLTQAGGPMMSMFAGPALVITGDQDLPFCGGDCSATGGMGASIPAAVKMGLPSAKNFEAYIQPNTGHGINLHYNATGAYTVIQNYLMGNGIAPK